MNQRTQENDRKPGEFAPAPAPARVHMPAFLHFNVSALGKLCNLRCTIHLMEKTTPSNAKQKLRPQGPPPPPPKYE
jgi:hypothetical protein